jgi:limonene-1,2-epoxide hydrolase
VSKNSSSSRLINFIRNISKKRSNSRTRSPQVEGFGKTIEGATYNNIYHVYFELEGGKIVRAREYNDMAHVFDTLRAGERRREGTANSIAKDKEALVSIVKEMSESMTGVQSTRHWAEDAVWFDIPPFASRGVQPALKFFDKVFRSFQSCKVDILETTSS